MNTSVLATEKDSHRLNHGGRVSICVFYVSFSQDKHNGHLLDLGRDFLAIASHKPVEEEKLDSVIPFLVLFFRFAFLA